MSTMASLAGARGIKDAAVRVFSWFQGVRNVVWWAARGANGFVWHPWISGKRVVVAGVHASELFIKELADPDLLEGANTADKGSKSSPPTPLRKGENSAGSSEQGADDAAGSDEDSRRGDEGRVILEAVPSSREVLAMHVHLVNGTLCDKAVRDKVLAVYPENLLRRWGDETSESLCRGSSGKCQGKFQEWHIRELAEDGHLNLDQTTAILYMFLNGSVPPKPSTFRHRLSWPAYLLHTRLA